MPKYEAYIVGRGEEVDLGVVDAQRVSDLMGHDRLDVIVGAVGVPAIARVERDVRSPTITWPDGRTSAVMARQEPVQPLPLAHRTVLVPFVDQPVVVVPP